MVAASDYKEAALGTHRSRAQQPSTGMVLRLREPRHGPDTKVLGKYRAFSKTEATLPQGGPQVPAEQVRETKTYNIAPPSGEQKKDIY